MAHERMSGRIQQLLDARTKFAARLEADPENPRVAIWVRKIAGYDLSLANFQKHGQETPPTGNKASVEIDVPKGTFKITEHVPEG